MARTHLEVDAQQLATLLWAWQWDVNALFQAPAQCFVQVPGKVGRGKHHHPRLSCRLAVQPINLHQQLGLDTPACFMLATCTAC